MALCDAIACVFLLSIAPPYGMSILHSYHCSGTCNHLRGRSRFTSCLLSKWLYFIVISDGPLYHNKKRQGTTTTQYNGNCSVVLYHNKKRQGTTTISQEEISDGPLYHNKKRQGTTTLSSSTTNLAILYHNKKRQGTTTDSKHIIREEILYHNKKRQKSDFQRSKPIRKMASRWCPGAVWSVRIGHKVFPYSFPYALNTGLSAAVQSNTTADDLFPKTNQKRPQRSQKDTLTTLSYNSFFSVDNTMQPQ